MKKIVTIISSLCLMFMIEISSSNIVYAQENVQYYIEEKIEILNSSYTKVANTRVARKTQTVKNSSGTRLWYVKVEGTFNYNGSSATCTKSTVFAGSYSSNWKIVSKISSKSSNKASATAKANCYGSSGSLIDSLTKTVTLTCHANGSVS